MTEHVVWQETEVSHSSRKELLGQHNRVFWMTGLSGSGKTTIAKGLEKELHDKGKLAYILDGDNLRHGLNKDLGFSKEDREENIRRVMEVAKLLHDAGVYVIVSFISPYKQDRDAAKELIGEDFREVYIKCSLEKCEERDPKKLYEKARAGIIKQFTGIDDPYEEPESPALVLDTENSTPRECVEKLLTLV